MKDQKYLGPLLGALITLGTVVFGSQQLFFSRAEGDDLRNEVRQDIRGLREDLKDLTKAILGGRRSANAKAPLQSTKVARHKPEAEVGTEAFFQSRNDVLRNQIFKQSGREFWLNSFGDEPIIRKAKEGSK